MQKTYFLNQFNNAAPARSGYSGYLRALVCGICAMYPDRSNNPSGLYAVVMFLVSLRSHGVSRYHRGSAATG